MTPTFWDIETAPLPLDILNSRMPEFKPNGTLKDPVKIAADVIAKKQQWIEDAALSPMTGQILVIGALTSEGVKVWDGEEKAILGQFWAYTVEAIWAARVLAGFNVHRFDLPFLVKRSWALGVKVPMEAIRKGRYWSDQLVDLRETWLMGDYQAHGSLDEISKFFGGTGKCGPSKDFHLLWESDREAALLKLEGDLNCTKQLWERMM
jgi:hypothetical protein